MTLDELHRLEAYMSFSQLRRSLDSDRDYVELQAALADEGKDENFKRLLSSLHEAYYYVGQVLGDLEKAITQ